MRGIWDAIVAWVDDKEPVTWMALFRIVVGGIVVVVLGDMITSGALEELWIPAADGRGPGDWRVRWLGGPSAAVTWGLAWVGLAGGVSVVLGAGSRVGALVAGQCLMALFSLAPGTGGGHDRLILNALWILVLAPAEASLSLVAWWRGRLFDPTPRAAWPRRALALQLVVVYFFAGVAKSAPEWWPWGNLEAVYRAVLHAAFAKHDLAPYMGVLFPLTQIGSLVTVLWETGFAVMLPWWWARRRGWAFGRWPVRTVMLGTGLVMHFVLWLTSNLGPFPFITVAYYLACFDDKDWRRLTGD